MSVIKWILLNGCPDSHNIISCYLPQVTRNIFLSISEAKASELLENYEKIFPLYFVVQNAQVPNLEQKKS